MFRTRTTLIAFTLTALATTYSFWQMPDAAPVLDAENVATEDSRAAAVEVDSTPVARDVQREANDAPYAMRRGLRVRYRARWTSSNTVSHKARIASSMTLRATGDLELHVLDSRRLEDSCGLDERRELLIALRLKNARVAGKTRSTTAPASALKPLQEDLAKWHAVRVDTHGHIQAYRFADGSRLECRNWIRSFVTALFVPYAHGGGDAPRRWSAQRPEANGHASLEVEWTHGNPDDVRVKKTEYVETNPRAPRTGFQSSQRLTLERSRGCASRAEVDEKFDVSVVDTDLAIRSASEAELELTHEESSTSEIADWSGTWMAASGIDDARRAAARSASSDEAARASRLCVHRLFAELSRLDLRDYSSPEVFAFLQDLSLLVRHAPETVRRVLDGVRDPNLSERQRALLVSALGQARAEVAQPALLDLATDPRTTESTRTEAVRAMFQQTDFLDETVRAIRALVDSKSTALASTSLLLLGSAAERDDATFAQLVALERKSRERGTVHDWFEALGNAGRAEALPVARRLLESRDAAERVGGLTALRRLDTPEVTTLLVHSASRDVDAAVRLSALRHLGKRRNDPSVRTAIQRISSTDSDENVRALAKRLLG